MQIKEINKLKNEIEKILNNNKALEVKSINLKDKTSIADFMIIASGNSSRHIQALSDILIDKLKKRINATVQQIGDTMMTGGVDSMEKYKYMLGQAHAYQLIIQEISNLLEPKEQKDEGNIIDIGKGSTKN